MGQTGVLRGLETPGPRLVHTLGLRAGYLLVGQQIVEVGVKPTACHHGRRLALECARSGIAWIGKELLALLLALRIELVERVPRHQHFAAYFNM